MKRKRVLEFVKKMKTCNSKKNYEGGDADKVCPLKKQSTATIIEQ